MDKKEIWKDVPDYEGLFQVSNKGRVKSKKRQVRRGYKYQIKTVPEKIRALSLDKHGYYHLALSKNNKRKNFFVHRLVALAFLKNPKNYPVINHIDGNKKNCCVENLEWASILQNNKHAYAIGLKKPSGNAIKYRPVAQYTIEGIFVAKYKSITEAINKTKITNIWPCVNKKPKYKTAGGYIWKDA
jgi:hypothetical protein